MKLLFDQNLSHRLPTRLSDLFPYSQHVRTAALDRAADSKIWEYATIHGFCIITQDSDFTERSRLYGAPPKVVWLRCGNSTPQQVESILRRNAVLITELIRDSDLHYLEII